MRASLLLAIVLVFNQLSSAFMPVMQIQAEETTSISVSQALSENQGTEVTVKGYIVAPFNSQYAIKVADENNDEAATIIVKLEADQREMFSPELNEEAIGKKVIVTGTRDEYSNQEAIEFVTSIEFADGDVNEGETPQGQTIAEARQQPDGTSVTIEGVVTADNLADPSGDQLSTYIQDETAGINIFAFDGSDLPELNEGDRIIITGELDTYNGLKEIIPNSGSDIEILAEGEAIPAATSVELSDLADETVAEPLEGQLVSVNGYLEDIPSSPAGGGYNLSFIDSDFNSTTLRVMEGTLDLSELNEGKWYDITAILSHYNSYQLVTRSINDFMASEEQPEAPSASGEYTSTVRYVSDGDTIRLEKPVLGADRVRFVNMDTPETNVAGANGVDEANQKEHGANATARLQELLQEGDQVTLKIGEQPTDDYGRLLAEVINKDGVNTNLQMVKEGLATSYFIWPIGDEENYQTYQKATKDAIDAEVGIWNPENPLKELPFEYRAISEGGDFHRYVGNSDTKEYVEPTEYEQVPVEVRIFFASAEEAEAQGYTAVSEEPLGEILELQLLSMNDLHGKIDQEYTLDRTGEEAVYGRMDYTAQAIKEREQENENTLLVHAGDMIGGSSPVSALLQDEPTVEIMNEMGFDVGTVGNHEFDEGLAELKRMVNGGDHPEGLGTTGYQGMNFDMLCANCIQEDTGETYLPPYAIKEVDGVEVGFIGVNTQETMNMVMPSSLENVAFTDEATAVNDAVEDLQAQGVEAIVVLAHMPATQSGNSATGASADLARNVDDAVDIIFAAHNHQEVDAVVDNKWIIQASEYGKAFADVDIQIDRETKDIHDVEAEIVFANQADYQPDPAVKEILDKYAVEIEDIVNEVIGYNAQQLEGQYTNDGDHGLGNLITDGMKWAMDADFAMHNGGGIRDILNEGPITWGEVFNILPFANTVMSVDIKGKDLIPILNDNLSSYGSDYSVSGLHYTYNYDYQHVVDITFPDGTPIDPEATYTLATNNYIGTQDGPISNLGTNETMGPVDVDAAVDYIKYLATTEDNPLVIGSEGRIAKTDEIPDVEEDGDVIGYNGQELVGTYTNGRDHGLGNLITDSMKDVMDSDFAVTNGGGIGSSLLEGNITTSSLEKILTHGNTLVKMEVTGEELETILNAQLSKNGSDYSIAGFSYRYNQKKEKVVSITLPNGKKVKKKDTYTLTTNSYLASRGAFASIESEREEGPVDVEALENYIVSLETTENNPLIYGSEDRISTVPNVSDNKVEIDDRIFTNVDMDGNVTIDLEGLEDINENKPVEISLTSDQITTLKEKNATLTIKKKDVTLDFPPSIFSGEQDTSIIIEKLPAVNGSKSAVYNFSINEGGNLITDFSHAEGVLLTFSITDKDVENTDLLKIFYLNPETGEWEEIGGTYQDGVVSATTTHFSTFTVMESSEEEESGEGNEDSDTNNGAETDNGEGGNTDGSTKGEETGTDEGTNQDQEESGSDNAKKENSSVENNELPETATSIFNYLLVGLVIITIGLLLYIRNRKTV
nr:5'-nucleotidase C-terminal domain-containing protein [Gracilibacillus kekensis]